MRLVEIRNYEQYRDETQSRWLTREVCASSSGIGAQWCKMGLVLVII